MHLVGGGLVDLAASAIGHGFGLGQITLSLVHLSQLDLQAGQCQAHVHDVPLVVLTLEQVIGLLVLLEGMEVGALIFMQFAEAQVAQGLSQRFARLHVVVHRLAVIVPRRVALAYVVLHKAHVAVAFGQASRVAQCDFSLEGLTQQTVGSSVVADFCLDQDDAVKGGNATLNHLGISRMLIDVT